MHQPTLEQLLAENEAFAYNDADTHLYESNLRDARDSVENNLRILLITLLAKYMQPTPAAETDKDRAKQQIIEARSAFLNPVKAKLATTPDKRAYKFAVIESIIDFLRDRDIAKELESAAYSLIDEIINIGESITATHPVHSLALTVDHKGISLYMRAVEAKCEAISELFIRYGADRDLRVEADAAMSLFRTGRGNNPDDNAALVASRHNFPVTLLAKTLTAENVAQVREFSTKRYDMQSIQNIARESNLNLEDAAIKCIAQARNFANAMHAEKLMAYYIAMRAYYARRDVFVRTAGNTRSSGKYLTPAFIQQVTKISEGALTKRIFKFDEPNKMHFEFAARRVVTNFCKINLTNIFIVVCNLLPVVDSHGHLPANFNAEVRANAIRKLFGNVYLADFAVEMFNFYMREFIPFRQAMELRTPPEMRDPEAMIIENYELRSEKARLQAVFVAEYDARIRTLEEAALPRPRRVQAAIAAAAEANENYDSFAATLRGMTL